MSLNTGQSYYTWPELCISFLTKQSGLHTTELLVEYILLCTLQEGNRV
jgi:hypothetical protein